MAPRRAAATRALVTPARISATCTATLAQILELTRAHSNGIETAPSLIPSIKANLESVKAGLETLAGQRSSPEQEEMVAGLQTQYRRLVDLVQALGVQIEAPIVPEETIIDVQEDAGEAVPLVRVTEPSSVRVDMSAVDEERDAAQLEEDAEEMRRANNDIVMMQRQMMDRAWLAHSWLTHAEQDETLDALSAAVRRQRDLSLHISSELELHSSLLEEVDAAVDSTDNRLRRANRGLERVTRAAKENASSCTIIGLVVLLVILMIAPGFDATVFLLLYVDKYRPTKLDDLHYHHDLSKSIRALASQGQDFPSILFYGPSGAGKKTRILCTLKELYGSGVDKRVFLTPSRKKLDVNVVQSNYHIELTPSDVGMYDRSVIQDIIKEIAQTQQVDLNAKKRFKVVVINEADQLSRDAQAALRRTMEKYTSNLRLILCATSTSKIIAPIRSRCLLVRVGAPNEEEISTVIRHVGKKERIDIPDHVVTLLARLSQGNLRRALLSLEATYTQDPTFASIDKDLISGKKAVSLDRIDAVPRPDWEKYCSKVAQKILAEQTPDRLLEIRGMLYELLTHCIPPTIIITTITRSLVDSVDDALKPDLVRWAAFYEHRAKSGSKSIFHLEAFVARVMSSVRAFSLIGLDGLEDMDF